MGDDRSMSYEHDTRPPIGAPDPDVTGRIQAVKVPPGSGHPITPPSPSTSHRAPRVRRVPVKPFKITPPHPIWEWFTTILIAVAALVLGFLLGMGHERGTWDDPGPVSGAGQRVDAPPTDDFDPGADVDVDGE